MDSENRYPVSHASQTVSPSYDELQRQVRDYEWLERCTVPAMDADDVLSLMVTVRALFLERFEFDRFGVLVGTVNEKFCVIHEIVTRDGMQACPPGSLMVVKSTGLEQVFLTRKLHYNPDILVNSEFIEDPELAAMGIRSLVRIPLMFKDKVFGVMTVKSIQSNQYCEDDLQLMEKVAKRLSTSIYSLKLIYQLKERTYKDALTGVLNRMFLNDIMSGKAESLIEEITGLTFSEVQRASVLFIDVDEFKKYNDYYGHAAGDARLTFVAKCLQEIVEEEGMVIRYGGDEFIVILPERTTVEAYEFIRKIQTQVALHNQTLQVEEAKYPLQLSVGVAAGDWTKMDALLHEADLKMYDHKEIQQTAAVKDA